MDVCWSCSGEEKSEEQGEEDWIEAWFLGGLKYDSVNSEGRFVLNLC
jgi:hypothetical protein